MMIDFSHSLDITREVPVWSLHMGDAEGRATDLTPSSNVRHLVGEGDTQF